jgi:RimJ/RimL family protein N-acetyltransferase
MRHDLRLIGHRFGLRPVEMTDAGFIVALRNDPELGRFLHRTSPRVEDQKAWLSAYFERTGDYYFVIEDLKLGEAVGTVGIYDVDAERGEAEWGRWLVARGSLAAVESALLIYRIAFDVLGLSAVASRTLADNTPVVSFHDSAGAPRRRVLKDHVVLNGKPHDSVEHRVERAAWAGMAPRLEMLARRVAEI